MTIKLELEVSDLLELMNIIQNGTLKNKIIQNNIDKIELLEEKKENKKSPKYGKRDTQCPYCEGFYSKNGMRLHVKSCEKLHKGIKANKSEALLKTAINETIFNKKSQKRGKYVPQQKDNKCPYCEEMFAGSGFTKHVNKCKRNHGIGSSRKPGKSNEKPLVGVFEGSVDRKVTIPDNAASIRMN